MTLVLGIPVWPRFVATTVCTRCHAGWPDGPLVCPYCGRRCETRGGYYVVPLPITVELPGVVLLDVD